MNGRKLSSSFFAIDIDEEKIKKYLIGIAINKLKANISDIALGILFTKDLSTISLVGTSG